MARAIAQETQQLETDLNEERSRYQNLLTEHLRLEEKYDDLKEEMVSSVRDTRAHTQAVLKRGFHNQTSFLCYSNFSENTFIWSIFQYFTSIAESRWFVTLNTKCFQIKSLSIKTLSSAERLQAWPQENRFHPQQQRIRVHLQLRVRRIGRRFPCRRSKTFTFQRMFIYSI